MVSMDFVRIGYNKTANQTNLPSKRDLLKEQYKSSLLNDWYGPLWIQNRTGASTGMSIADMLDLTSAAPKLQDKVITIRIDRSMNIKIERALVEHELNSRSGT